MGYNLKQVSDKMTEIIVGMVELRLQIKMQTETDFYALGDVTMSDNMKTYRQVLRDLTPSNDGKNATLKEKSWKI